jgi:hypothetical protein
MPGEGLCVSREHQRPKRKDQGEMSWLRRGSSTTPSVGREKGSARQSSIPIGVLTLPSTSPSLRSTAHRQSSWPCCCRAVRIPGIWVQMQLRQKQLASPYAGIQPPLPLPLLALLTCYSTDNTVEYAWQGSLLVLRRIDCAPSHLLAGGWVYDNDHDDLMGFVVAPCRCHCCKDV